MTVADNIRFIINDSGLQQKTIAERAGWDPKSFDALLSGRRVFRADYLPAICRAIGKSPDEVFFYTNNETPECGSK